MKTRWVLTCFVFFYFVIMTTHIYLLPKQYNVESDRGREVGVIMDSSISHRDNDHVKTFNLVTKKNDVEQIRWYGPGENGKEVNFKGINLSFPGLSERNKKHGFNTFISDMIGVHRKLPDMRNILCKTRVYPANLPPITVVVIFRDEWWSILLRTVYSILEISPPELIYEVIVVDDGSTDKDLLTKVKLHIQNLDKVRLIQNKTPRGLMMARQTGIDAVQSDMFIVMDGHMEVGPGWLEPLVHRLVQQPKSLLCSIIGQINHEQFKYSNLEEFDNIFPFFDHITLHEMFATYKEEFRTKRNHSVEPIPTGTIQGMMMVMRKDFFLQLGGFDPGMEVWGSEQIELSVKVWMCGGVVEMVPCSIVAHMYRQTPWGSTKGTNDFISLNKARLTKVWIDPPFNENINHYLRDKNYTAGNLTPRHRIRELNRCKPYQYFIDKVKSFSDVYITTNTGIRYRGKIQNEKFNTCLWASRINVKLEQYACPRIVSWNHFFIFTETNQIRGISDTLVDVKWDNGEVAIYIRHSSSVYSSPTTEWQYNGRRLVHTKTNMCLTALTVSTLDLKPCIDSESQRWYLEKAKKGLAIDAITGS